MIWLEMLTVEVCKKYVIHPHFPPTLILGSFIFYEFFNPFLPSPQPAAPAAPAAPRTANSSPGTAVLTPATAFHRRRLEGNTTVASPPPSFPWALPGLQPAPVLPPPRRRQRPRRSHVPLLKRTPIISLPIAWENLEKSFVSLRAKLYKAWEVILN